MSLRWARAVYCIGKGVTKGGRQFTDCVHGEEGAWGAVAGNGSFPNWVFPASGLRGRSVNQHPGKSRLGRGGKRTYHLGTSEFPAACRKRLRRGSSQPQSSSPFPCGDLAGSPRVGDVVGWLRSTGPGHGRGACLDSPAPPMPEPHIYFRKKLYQNLSGI